MGTDQTAPVGAAIEKWAALFHRVKFGTIRLYSSDGAVWVPRLGLVANVYLYDRKPHRAQRADLVVAAPDELGSLDGVLARVETVIATLKADESLARKALDRPLSETFGLRVAALCADTFAPTKEDIERRQRALAESFARFDAVAARMKEVHGLRLPRHLAVWAALHRSLSPLEKIGLQTLWRSPTGIMIWFQDGGLERKTKDGLDPRLEMRFRRDPPEFVTVMHGDSDGLHYGLWYDDPAELPSFIAHNYARDSAETSAGEATVLRTLAEQTRKRIEEPDDPEEPVPLSMHALAAALQWFRDADEKALAEEGPGRWADTERGTIVGDLAPAFPPGSGDARATREALDERYAAYQDKERAAEVTALIDQARGELKRGEPAFALVLGRELHWLDADAYRAASLKLLCDAYEALGRHALAEIAKVHHAHRDLDSVGIYEGE